jgi:hypothetical protein
MQRRQCIVLQLPPCALGGFNIILFWNQAENHRYWQKNNFLLSSLMQAFKNATKNVICKNHEKMCKNENTPNSACFDTHIYILDEINGWVIKALFKIFLMQTGKTVHFQTNCK